MKTCIALIFAGALAGCGLLGARGGAAGATSAAAAQRDARFLRDMALGNLAEIDAGRLAAARGRSLAVRRYGEWMADDRVALEAQAARVAQARGQQPPTGADASHRAPLEDLRAMSGAGFDRAYLELALRDDADALALLREVVAQAADRRLRELAERAMPHVEQQLNEAKRLAGSVG